MAFKTEMVENKIAVNYHGVVVYHTHKDNNIDNSVNDYIFSLDPYGNEYSVDEGDGEVFDIATVLTCCNRYYVNTGAEVICALMKDGEVKKGISNIECFAPSTMTKYKGE